MDYVMSYSFIYYFLLLLTRGINLTSKLLLGRAWFDFLVIHMWMVSGHLYDFSSKYNVLWTLLIYDFVVFLGINHKWILCFFSGFEMDEDDDDDGKLCDICLSSRLKEKLD